MGNAQSDKPAKVDGNAANYHFGEIRTFPPKESFHRSITVALSCAEVIDVLLFLTSGSFATSRSFLAG